MTILTVDGAVNNIYEIKNNTGNIHLIIQIILILM